MANKNIIFSAAVRGFHVYQASWKPENGEVLQCMHEKNNPYDMFSMKVCKLNSDEIVGHLPMEISRITKFIEDRGAKISLKIRGRHYRRSPLIQGGLEVPCDVTITMVRSVVNHLLLTRYEALLKEFYLEPKEEEIIGTFLSLANETEIEIEPRLRPAAATRKDRPKKKDFSSVSSRDIREMIRNPKKKKENNKVTIVLD